jgi:hypothetical protein
VLSEEYGEGGTKLVVRGDPRIVARLRSSLA